ncbi:hypothetical protein [Pseudomonas sp. Teo4]|uniref:hypothetical protein n=1 Tax=Pseudomonas sp. Teo4 TaxID=3064528 RepID=UPI002ACB1744|nr:hypothetical protein [Pseudomonas sp. Teo4]
MNTSLMIASREELLEQQCLLLENELAVMGEELTVSRENPTQASHCRFREDCC